MTRSKLPHPMTDASIGHADGVEFRGGLPILTFMEAAAFDVWLHAEPRTSTGAWLKLSKKGSALVTMTRAEAVDASLCHGWIDGQQDRYDEASWLVRITPRKRASRWSEINRTRAIELVGMGLVRPAGLAEIEAAQADGRWDAAYAPASTIQVPPDLQAALEALPEAAAAFAKLKRSERYAVLYRISNVKMKATKARLVREYVAAFGQDLSAR